MLCYVYFRITEYVCDSIYKGFCNLCWYKLEDRDVVARCGIEWVCKYASVLVDMWVLMGVCWGSSNKVGMHQEYVLEARDHDESTLCSYLLL